MQKKFYINYIIISYYRYALNICERMQLFRELIITLLATSVAKKRAREKLVNGTHGPKGYSRIGYKGIQQR